MQSTEYDAIVVGSGIAGGWAAKELTEKGLRVLLLERGKNVEHIKDYVNATKGPWEYPHRGGRTAQMEKDYPVLKRDYPLNEKNLDWWVNEQESPYTEVRRFDWYRGYQVGGRSLLWGRQSYRHSDIDFSANAREGIAVDWPIRYADIAPWYDYVEEWIGVSGQAEGLPQLPDGIFQPPMEMNCVELDAKAKIEAKIPGRKITIGRTAHITQQNEIQKELGRGRCQFRNLCMRGCPYGAYFSSNAGTLPAAERTGNMTLRPNSIVHSIIYDMQTGKAKGVKILDAETRQEMEFYSKIIFLNASTFNSTWILMNSANERFPTGLGNSSDQLGRNVMDHHLGAGAAGRSDDFGDRYYSGRRANGIYIPRFQNLKGGPKHKDFLRGYGYQGGASRSNWHSLVAELGFGKRMKEQMQEPGEWHMGITGFGEILPHPDNRITLNKDLLDMYGMPTLTMDVEMKENELAMRKDIMVEAAEMLEAAGLKDVHSYDGDYGPGLGIHEMGTARMGRDPKTSVLNKWNQLHDVPNVFITDGACMTSAACVNPSLTYMALTARACDYAVKELNKGNL